MDVGVGILFLAVLCAEIALLLVLGGRHIYFRYNAMSSCVDDNVIEPGDIENVDVGFLNFVSSCPAMC